MKKKISFMMAAAILLCAVLTGCTNKMETKQYTSELYTVNIRGDRCYIMFDEESWNEQSAKDSYQDCTVAVYPEFATLKEMRQAVIDGSFTDAEQEQIMKVLKYAPRNEDGSVEIYNIDKLIECVTPAGMEVEYILWKVLSYSFHLSGPVRASIYCVSKEDYDENMNTKYQSFLENEHITVTAQEMDEERSAEVYYTTSGNDTYSKYICYEILEGTKRIVVEECYLLGYPSENASWMPEASETVPEGVSIWIEDGDNYAYVLFSRFEERPSVEWLSQFGLKEYVETEAA